jgi:hypothetical protein
MSSRGYSGEYQALYKYLRDRFADRVVLTFAEIEDLLGFTLPDLARLKYEWWASSDAAAASSAHANAWMAASRTAVANLSSQRVVFDRQP